MKEIKDVIKNIKQYKIFHSEEGTLLRLFYHNKVWYISTNKKLDAFNSRWSAKHSFGEILVNSLFNLYTYQNGYLKALGKEETRETILKSFLDSLDTSKSYMILLRSNRYTRIVCKETKGSEIFHVGSMVKGNVSFNEDIGLPKQDTLTFENVEEMVKYVETLDPFRYQGIILFHGRTQYKIYNSAYKNYKTIRGNQPSVFFRYLQVRNDTKLTNVLYELYPYESHWFQIYEKILYNVAVRILKCYIRRYIRKQYTSLPKLEYLIMKECFEWYHENTTENKVTIAKIISILNTKPAPYLHSLIKLVQMKRQQRQRRTTPVHRSLIKPLSNRILTNPL